MPKNPSEYVSENGKDIFLQNIDDAVLFDNYKFHKRTYDAVEKKKAQENEKSFSGLIKYPPLALKIGVAVLKVACRDPAMLKHVITLVPKDIFDAEHQKAIEYLKICLDENSRPLKEGAAIFFEGKIVKEFQNILESKEPLSDEERLAFEDAFEYLLKLIKEKEYSDKITDALISDKVLAELSQMNSDKDY